MEFVQRLLTLLSVAYCVTQSQSGIDHLHRNPCIAHTVESKDRSMANYFGSNNIFFPHEYREVYCNTYSSSNNLNEKLSTCAGGLYHCVTKYEIRDVLELPNKEPISFSQIRLHKIKIAVGCNCVT